MKDIAIIFDGTCVYTTGYFIRDAFTLAGWNVTQYTPYQHLESHSYYLYVDSGHEYAINSPKEKTYIYDIDCYQNGMKLLPKNSWMYNLNTRENWWKYVLTKINGSFHAFRYGENWFHANGFNNTKFIGMGIDPSVYYREKKEPIYDICFIGSKNTYGGRDKILDVVRRNFKLYEEFTYKDGIRIANSNSKCFLDIPPFCDNMLGQRYFEGLGCQAKIVSMDRPELYEHDMTGFYVYNMGDLEKSLIIAVTDAINAPEVTRDIRRYLWGSIVKYSMEPLILGSHG